MELADVCFNFTNRAFRKDAAEVVQRANKVGVRYFVVTGCNVEDSEYALQLTTRYAGMYATAGVHPHLAKQWDDATVPRLRALAAHEKVVAIGEAGLDFNRNYSDAAQQKRAFAAQLELAAELALPVFLHERDAYDDFVKLVSQFREQLAGVVVHCFTGNAAHLDRYIDLDCHIGITGWICDERRGQHLQQIIARIPTNRLMIETDAPYLLPRDLPVDSAFPKPRDRRNEPAYLPHILTTVANCRQTSIAQTAMETTRTARQFFSI